MPKLYTLGELKESGLKSISWKNCFDLVDGKYVAKHPNLPLPNKMSSEMYGEYYRLYDLFFEKKRQELHGPNKSLVIPFYMDIDKYACDKAIIELFRGK